MVLTEMSDIPAPDMLSDSSRSLSGSPCTFDASDLFFRIDLERRCDSRFGDASIESIDSDSLFSDLPVASQLNFKKELINCIINAIAPTGQCLNISYDQQLFISKKCFRL